MPNIPPQQNLLTSEKNKRLTLPPKNHGSVENAFLQDYFPFTMSQRDLSQSNLVDSKWRDITQLLNYQPKCTQLSGQME